MSTVAKDALDVDELLEQVAIAMTSGGHDTALKLLPQIMASGDDIQRQMAESYKMQLEALIAMEQEAAELAELLDGDNESGALSDTETVAHDDDLLKGPDDSTDQAGDTFETQEIDASTDATAVLDNADSEAVVTDNTSADDNEDNTETLEFTAREREIDTALEQVAVLIMKTPLKQPPPKRQMKNNL